MNDMLGHNNPPPFDRLSLRKDELMKGMEKLATDFPDLNTQELCDQASDFKKQFIILRDQIDTAFAEEKRPWLVGGKAVDDKWRGMKQLIPIAISQIEKRLSAGLLKMNAKRDEERRQAQAKLDQEREAAEKLQREADELVRKADAGELVGSGAEVMAAQERAIEAKADVKQASREVRELQGTAKAGTGTVDGVKRRTSLRAFYSAEIVNLRAVIAYLLTEDESRERIADTIQALANAKVKSIMAAAKDGDNPDMPPGITLKVEHRAV